MVPLAHPDASKEVYLCWDASQGFWGATFCKRLEYLLLRPGGFHLFTDHRNPVYRFGHFSTDTAMQRYQADKLQRWAMTMTSYKYVIEHILGEENTWADMLSCWGCAPQPPDSRGLSIQQLAVVRPISPLEGDAFQRPDIGEIRDVQEEEPSRPSGIFGILNENATRQKAG
ncbi:unnamed protein product [Phytophthora fragariaefolia]|uniref:Unnamed protein product n=1 Tax=Phytophthora fragariaefolia TaxID=1490495 RepID=A0A9W6XGB5_9STRA|nr:unnamed protein product [Phytophthora fragariaefolia]